MKIELINREEYIVSIGKYVDFGFQIMEECPIGMIYVNEIGKNYSIEWMKIYPEYQEQGYMRKVILAVMDFFKINEIYLESTMVYVPLCEHIGFRKVEYHSYDKKTTMFLKKTDLFKKRSKKREIQRTYKVSKRSYSFA